MPASPQQPAWGQLKPLPAPKAPSLPAPFDGYKGLCPQTLRLTGPTAPSARWQRHPTATATSSSPSPIRPLHDARHQSPERRPQSNDPSTRTSFKHPRCPHFQISGTSGPGSSCQTHVRVLQPRGVQRGGHGPGDAPSLQSTTARSHLWGGIPLERAEVYFSPLINNSSALPSLCSGQAGETPPPRASRLLISPDRRHCSDLTRQCPGHSRELAVPRDGRQEPQSPGSDPCKGRALAATGLRQVLSAQTPSQQGSAPPVQLASECN